MRTSPARPPGLLPGRGSRSVSSNTSTTHRRGVRDLLPGSGAAPARGCSSATSVRSGWSVSMSASNSGSPSGRCASDQRERLLHPVAAARRRAPPRRTGTRSGTASISGSSCGLGTVSTLLMTRSAGFPTACSRSRMIRLPGRDLGGFSSGLAGSMRKRTRSTSSARVRAASTMHRLSAPFAWWMPGVSTNATCPSGRVTTPRMRLRVVCGLGETMAIFSPVSRLSSVLLPTLGRPMSAAKPRAGSGIGR